MQSANANVDKNLKTTELHTTQTIKAHVIFVLYMFDYVSSFKQTLWNCRHKLLFQTCFTCVSGTHSSSFWMTNIMKQKQWWLLAIETFHRSLIYLAVTVQSVNMYCFNISKLEVLCCLGTASCHCIAAWSQSWFRPFWRLHWCWRFMNT